MQNKKGSPAEKLPTSSGASARGREAALVLTARPGAGDDDSAFADQDTKIPGGKTTRQDRTAGKWPHGGLPPSRAARCPGTVQKPSSSSPVPQFPLRSHPETARAFLVLFVDSVLHSRPTPLPRNKQNLKEGREVGEKW